MGQQYNLVNITRVTLEKAVLLIVLSSKQNHLAKITSPSKHR